MDSTRIEIVEQSHSWQTRTGQCGTDWSTAHLRLSHLQMERLKKDLQDETSKSREIEEQLRQIDDNGSEQRAHMDNVNTRVRDLRQKKSDLAAQKT